MKRKSKGRRFLQETKGLAMDLVGFNVVGNIGASTVSKVGGDPSSVERLTKYTPLIANIGGAGLALKGVKKLKRKSHF